MNGVTAFGLFLANLLLVDCVPYRYPFDTAYYQPQFIQTTTTTLKRSATNSNEAAGVNQDIGYNLKSTKVNNASRVNRHSAQRTLATTTAQQTQTNFNANGANKNENGYKSPHKIRNRGTIQYKSYLRDAHTNKAEHDQSAAAAAAGYYVGAGYLPPLMETVTATTAGNHQFKQNSLQTVNTINSLNTQQQFGYDESNGGIRTKTFGSHNQNNKVPLRNKTTIAGGGTNFLSLDEKNRGQATASYPIHRTILPPPIQTKTDYTQNNTMRTDTTIVTSVIPTIGLDETRRGGLSTNTARRFDTTNQGAMTTQLGLDETRRGGISTNTAVNTNRQNVKCDCAADTTLRSEINLTQNTTTNTRTNVNTFNENSLAHGINNLGVPNYMQPTLEQNNQAGIQNLMPNVDPKLLLDELNKARGINLPGVDSSALVVNQFLILHKTELGYEIRFPASIILNNEQQAINRAASQDTKNLTIEGRNGVVVNQILIIQNSSDILKIGGFVINGSTPQSMVPIRNQQRKGLDESNAARGSNINGNNNNNANQNFGLDENSRSSVSQNTQNLLTTSTLYEDNRTEFSFNEENLATGMQFLGPILQPISPGLDEDAKARGNAYPVQPTNNNLIPTSNSSGGSTSTVEPPCDSEFELQHSKSAGSFGSHSVHIHIYGGNNSFSGQISHSNYGENDGYSRRAAASNKQRNK